MSLTLPSGVRSLGWKDWGGSLLSGDGEPSCCNGHGDTVNCRSRHYGLAL